MAVRSSALGISPVSLLAVAFTRIMNRIVFSPLSVPQEPAAVAALHTRRTGGHRIDTPVEKNFSPAHR
jgi:hypothetical protein